MVDHALRRRFAFFTLSPSFARPQRFKQWLTSQLSDEEGADLADGASNADAAKQVVERIVQSMTEINRRIAKSKLLGEGFVLGHSYFCNQPSRGGVDDPVDWMMRIFREEIAPMLREYAADQPTLLDHLIEPIRDLLAEGAT
jgi:5-methylcytosine-specific restriction protein B